eukprot:754762-Hanusia_phi.AAC.4
MVGEEEEKREREGGRRGRERGERRERRERREMTRVSQMRRDLLLVVLLVNMWEVKAPKEQGQEEERSTARAWCRSRHDSGGVLEGDGSAARSSCLNVGSRLEGRRARERCYPLLW